MNSIITSVKCHFVSYNDMTIFMYFYFIQDILSKNRNVAISKKKKQKKNSFIFSTLMHKIEMSLKLKKSHFFNTNAQDCHVFNDT